MRKFSLQNKHGVELYRNVRVSDIIRTAKNMNNTQHSKMKYIFFVFRLPRQQPFYNKARGELCQGRCECTHRTS